MEKELSKESIQQHWQQKELPGINCIIKENGSIIILNFYKAVHGDQKHYYLKPLCETDLENLEKFNDDVWTEIEINPNIKVSPQGDVILCGEGGMGNEGFVASVSKDRKTLKWALFCTESNPFNKLELGGNKIIAYSTYNLKFIIDMDQPEDIEIEHLTDSHL